MERPFASAGILVYRLREVSKENRGARRGRGGVGDRGREERSLEVWLEKDPSDTICDRPIAVNGCGSAREVVVGGVLWPNGKARWLQLALVGNRRERVASRAGEANTGLGEVTNVE